MDKTPPEKSLFAILFWMNKSNCRPSRRLSPDAVMPRGFFLIALLYGNCA